MEIGSFMGSIFSFSPAASMNDTDSKPSAPFNFTDEGDVFIRTKKPGEGPLYGENEDSGPGPAVAMDDD